MNAEISLYETFDRVVVINLARRAQRMARFRKLLKSWPFKTPRRFEAIDGLTVKIPSDWTKGPGAWGCMLSHRAVLASAIADNISSLFVLEDDAYPVADFTARAIDFLSRVPDDWDCLMFGAEHIVPPQPVSPGIVRCMGSNRTHAYAIRGRMIPLFLEYLNRYTTEHCDIILASMMQYLRAYAPEPFLIGQDAGFSDITERHEDLRFLPPERIENLAAAGS